MTGAQNWAIMINMEHNEANPTEAVEVDISLVYYCASLLQTNPANLLNYVVEARS